MKSLIGRLGPLTIRYTIRMSISLEHRRLVIIYSPRSARAKLVQEMVFDKLDQAGYSYEKLEVLQAPLEDNINHLAPKLQPNDLILSSAGDGSAHAIMNSVMAADLPGVSLGFLGFGNFNDAAHAFTKKNSIRDPLTFLSSVNKSLAYPIDLYMNNQKLRSSLLYITLGWTARAANRFDDPAVRMKLRKGSTSLPKNLLDLGIYYFRTRTSSLLPSFSIGGTSYEKVTDVIIANGPTVARLFKTGNPYYFADKFLVRMLDVSGLIMNIPFLFLAMANRMSGDKLDSITLNFKSPSTVPVQCDGEVVILEGVNSISIKKSAKPIQILTNK